LIVMKFGGTSVAEADRILGVAEIVRARMDRRPIVVVSALAGVTDLLVQAVAAARRGDLAGLEPILADLERRHRWALAGSVETSRDRHHLSLDVDGLFEDLKEKLRSIRILGEGTPRAADAILAYGETLSARIVASAFQGLGLPAAPLDPRDVLLTDDRFGEAKPDLDGVGTRCLERITPMLEQGQIPILGGFVGATAEGETTTLGRGGSDTSAAVLGSVLDAEEIQIWTDVDGLMSADPRLVPEAHPIPQLSFAEAVELAFYGAKVLHPDSLAPAVRRRIPVRVLNSMRPEAPGTVILDEAPPSSGADVVSVASRPGVRAVRVSSPRMRVDPEFAAGVLGSLSAQQVAPDLVVASEVAVDLVLSGKLDLPRLEECLGRHGDVAVREERAIICAVGSKLTEGSARRRALEALAEWEPELVGLGGSGVSVTAVIPTPRLSEAVRGLHRRFFEEARAG